MIFGKRNRNRKKRPPLHPKHLFIFFSVVCCLLVLFSFKFSNQMSGVKSIVGNIITPMQKGINSVGTFLSDQVDLLQSKKDLLAKNQELQDKVDSLSYDNKVLSGEIVELDNYRAMFQLDKKYPDYPKVAARVISRDGNNWFNVFTIDKGSADGIAVDMNVIAGNGLVGIVSEVGTHYAKVRSIIDDKSRVSAMFQSTSETCIIRGNLENYDSGYIDVEMINGTADIKDGDEVVTSQISDKFLQGLLIGYVSNVKEDPIAQTKTANLTPVVTFDNLEMVLVITTVKNSAEIGDVSN